MMKRYLHTIYKSGRVIQHLLLLGLERLANPADDVYFCTRLEAGELIFEIIWVGGIRHVSIPVPLPEGTRSWSVDEFRSSFGQIYCVPLVRQDHIHLSVYIYSPLYRSIWRIILWPNGCGTFLRMNRSIKC